MKKVCLASILLLVPTTMYAMENMQKNTLPSLKVALENCTLTDRETFCNNTYQLWAKIYPESDLKKLAQTTITDPRILALVYLQQGYKEEGITRIGEPVRTFIPGFGVTSHGFVEITVSPQNKN